MARSNVRNLVAADMGTKFKSKRFANDRGNRRANDTRNTKSYMEEIHDDFDSDLDTSLFGE